MTISIDRRSLLWTTALGAGAAFVPADLALAQAPSGGTLRIAMTASAIPLPNGQTDQGGEGQRFIGYTLFDSLVFWDLSQSNAPSRLVPNLATEWAIDPTSDTRWIFKLRPDVTFHDGSPFDAAAVVWNIEKLLDQSKPQFDPRQAAQGRSRIPTVARAEVIDPMTVAIITNAPDALLPYGIAWIVMSSPAQWEKVGRSWDAFLNAPSGTGPFKLTEYNPRERAVLVPNTAYWNVARRPKTDRVILLPMPEATTRASALRANRVDWVEAPPPDLIPSLERAGFKIVTNEYPHVWIWHFSMMEGSPWRDVRVRQAANLAIDRDGIAGLLGGTMQPALGLVTASSPWFGSPAFRVRHDPAEARRLLAAAGITPRTPIRTKVLIPSSGSGMMQPIPMNEAIQQGLRQVGINVDYEVTDWNVLTTAWRAGARDAASRGATAHNNSYFSQDPFTALIRHLDSNLQAPRGTNWGHYEDPAMDALFAQMRTTFEPAALDAVVRQAHEKVVNEALFLFVAHDLNPRAMRAQVRGFVQARNWFQDLGPVTVG